MSLSKVLPYILALFTLATPARASEFTVSVDGNLFDTSPLNTQNSGLGARVGGHAALDITLFSSQLDWRLGSSFQPFPTSDASFLVYAGPQLRLLPGNDTPYLGAGLGVGLTNTLRRQSEGDALLGFILPIKATVWTGYRFADLASQRSQSVEGYGTIGIDGLTVGIRWGFKL